MQEIVTICCTALLVPGEGLILAQAAAQTAQSSPAPADTSKASPAVAASDEKPEPKITPEQLESLVAPIALYPDELLAQALVASTYPLELVQLDQWLDKNKDLKDKALADAVAKQPWDPSIQSMAAVPDVVKRLADDIQWTTDLGNAFLAQQGDVMDAVQRMRKKAQDKGALESNEQQKVETKVIEEKTIIVVESANPEVIYVPSYSPLVVYGPPVYPYPPIYYPPYYAGAAFVSFGFGVAMGAAIWGGSCCGCGWGGNNVNINVNNNFNRNTNVGGGRGGAGGGNWNHNPSHRGGTPYGTRRRPTSMAVRRAVPRPATGRRPAASRARATAPRAARGTGASNRAAGGARASASNRRGGAEGTVRATALGGASTSSSGGSQIGSGGSSNRAAFRRAADRSPAGSVAVLSGLQRKQRPVEQLARLLQHGSAGRWLRGWRRRQRRRRSEVDRDGTSNRWSAVSRIRSGAGHLGLCMGVMCDPAGTGSARRAPNETPAAASTVQQKIFNTPEEAAEALILAAEQFDVPALKEILGPDGADLVVSEDPVQDKNH